MDFEQALKIVDPIEGHMTIFELEWLYKAVSSLPDNSRILEIGTFCGRSTIIMSLAARACHIISIDKDNIGQNICQQHLEQQKLDNVKLINGNSVELVPTLGLFDFAFVDGDHGFPTVFYDIAHCARQVKSGGLIAGHDYTFENGVRPATDELIKYNTRAFADFAVFRKDDNDDIIGNIWHARKIHQHIGKFAMTICGWST